MASAAFLLAPQNSSVNPGSTETNNDDDMVELLTASELPFAESADMVTEPWPALNPEREDWEMVVTPVTVEVTMNPVVTFDVSVLERTVTTSTSVNPKTLMHAQSSPDLRAWKKDEDGSEEETSSEVFVEEDPSSASSDMDMVSGPPSVWSINSSHHKLSFKEVVLQQKTQPATMVQKPNDRHSLSARNSPSTKPSKKTTFVVVPPHSQKVAAGLKRNSKSMGNLRALDHIQEEILGETDAELFYSQKALGAKGRESGLRIRPDEAKRLEITMNKKHQQRQQQQQRQTVVK